MEVRFTNAGRNIISVIVDGTACVTLNPKQSQIVNIYGDAPHQVVIRCEKESYKDWKGFYNLNIATSFCLRNIGNGCECRISQKKIETSINVSLMKAELCASAAECFMTDCRVTDAEKIMKKYKRSRYADIFFFDPIFSSFGEVFIAVLIGIAIFWFLGWKAGLIYTAIAYGFFVVLNLFIEKLLNTIFNKIFKIKMSKEKKEFSDFLNADYLFKYLSDPNNWN